MKPIKGMIDIETIQIFLEGAEERLKFKTISSFERYFLYGMTAAYRDLIQNHVKAHRGMGSKE
ncbi:hypothetical protein SAMN03159341_11731 [Paenibacillus sp. 1_12]|uniref:hypothetical protein n=1 Tax=Paenibacillus sp. 1_12 TaxID=1566278 RepID=UPI0008F04B86|nr:hypothetical protein [Paenibacillus sp. 1_12]SFM12191.1 hypothetical protein SAMN03159341_11731 [Paenibacillus sp. 1_12]